MADLSEAELENFYDALYNLSVGVEPFKTKIGSREALAEPSPGAVDVDGRTAMYIDYSFAEKTDEEYGESGRRETYVPGFLDGSDVEPALWDEEREEIRSELPSETADNVVFRTRSHFLPGENSEPETDAPHRYFNRLLFEEGIDFERYLDSGMEPSTGVVRIMNSYYGYVEAETFKDGGLESDIIVVGELGPEGELEPVEDDRALEAVERKLRGKVDNIREVRPEKADRQ